jgi:hypothetical protein
LKVFAPSLKVSLERFRRIKIDGAQLGGGIQKTMRLQLETQFCEILF